MRRHLLGYVVAFVCLGALGALAATGDHVPEDAHCVEVEELGVFVCGTTTTSTAESSTSSSLAETTTTVLDSTTTSTEPATTTTVPVTTMTQAPTTTTTLPSSSDLTIPETLPYPSDSTIRDGEGFFFSIWCNTTDEVECPNPKDNGDRFLDDFTYMGHGMQYLHPGSVEGMHQHSWWVEGDREAYRCSYAFMYDQHPNPFGMLDEDRPAEFIARATIVVPPDGSYGKIVDKFMDEVVRFYDGSPWEGGTSFPRDTAQNCLSEALDADFDYGNYEPHGPDQIRVGLFLEDGAIADIRPFKDRSTEGWYEFVSIGERSFQDRDGNPYTVTRVVIVHVLEGEGVNHALYYDTLNSGRIAVEVNGSLIGG